MRTQHVFLLLIALLWLSTVASAQRTANQPIEWIVRETSGDDQWGYVAPDGVAITYSRSLDGQTWQLGGRPYQVSAGQGRQPDWSPEGGWLAFASNRGDSTGRHAVFVVDRTGRNLIQLTDHSPNAQRPVWSPDGTWCCFSRGNGAKWGVWARANRCSEVAEVIICLTWRWT
jgi:hypothetical protein